MIVEGMRRYVFILLEDFAFLGAQNRVIFLEATFFLSSVFGPLVFFFFLFLSFFSYIFSIIEHYHDFYFQLFMCFTFNFVSISLPKCKKLITPRYLWWRMELIFHLETYRMSKQHIGWKSFFEVVTLCSHFS